MQHEVISQGIFYKGVTKDFKSPIQSNQSTYLPGTTVEVDYVDTDPAKDCGAGINICRSLADALRFAKEGTVVIVKVPDGDTIIDAGTKLRVKRVEVVSRANLYGADLSSADLSSADLYGANLYGADLYGANLYGADLYGADLSSADLSRANLYGANLYGANLYGANLYGADLSRANLYGANLSSANLYGARGDQYTTLPAGYKVNDSGLIVKSS